MLKKKHTTPLPPLLFFLLLSSIAASVNVGLAEAGTGDGRKLAGNSPFTAKASLIRYWRRQVSNNLPGSWFLDKASPLDAVQLATFSKLAGQNSLSTQLPAFCTQANLLCFPDVSASLEKHTTDANFAEYRFENFTNYGTDRVGGADAFKNYSNGENIPLDTFGQYSRGSTGHNDEFTNYGLNGNVADQSFSSYGKNTQAGTGEFKNYNDEINGIGLAFTSYSEGTGGREQDFKEYGTGANFGDGTFKSYGKGGNGATNDFTAYGNNSNIITSDFENYDENGNGATGTFSSYGTNGNVPVNDFKSYSIDGNGATETFTNYADGGNNATSSFKSYATGSNGITQSFANYRNNSNGFKNYGEDAFQTYGKDANGLGLDFSNYGQSAIIGTDTFESYGKDGNGETVGFKLYGINNTFKDYSKTGLLSLTFASYQNETGSPSTSALAAAATHKSVNNRWVEPGKFFREQMLKTGTVMPMPDIKDKMPKRSFLPPAILSKIPFSTSKIGDLKRVFHTGDESRMSRMMTDALNECERAPSAGETKRCVGSGEDMVDFATSVLGKNVAVRSTESTRGSGGGILIGDVKGINGGQITKSVSCHQSLYPYLLYYCHSVPQVRVYEADLLDPKSKAKINHGVAICHIDTSSWSPGHGAFFALGSGPGKIEVCHWIFENDMTWTIAD